MTGAALNFGDPNQYNIKSTYEQDRNDINMSLRRVWRYERIHKTSLIDHRDIKRSLSDR